MSKERVIRRQTTFDAVEWKGDNLEEVRDITGMAELKPEEDGSLVIITYIGPMTVKKGWFLVKGKGLSILRPEDFHKEFFILDEEY